MSDAPERIWLTPEDAAAFGRKYGHPGVTMVCVGDPSVSYVHEDQVNALVAAAYEAAAQGVHYIHDAGEYDDAPGNVSGYIRSLTHADAQAALAAAEARAKAAEERRDNISEALAEMVEEVGFFLRNFDVGKPVHANRMRASAVHARAALIDKGDTDNDG